MGRKWNLANQKMHLSIGYEIHRMYNGEKFFYDNNKKSFQGTIEKLYIHDDDTADMHMFGKDDDGHEGHYCFRLKIHRNGFVTVESGTKQP